MTALTGSFGVLRVLSCQDESGSPFLSGLKMVVKPSHGAFECSALNLDFTPGSMEGLDVSAQVCI